MCCRVHRDIKLNLKRDLIEVKSATKEVVFNIIGGEGETETYTVSRWSGPRFVDGGSTVNKDHRRRVSRGCTVPRVCPRRVYYCPVSLLRTKSLYGGSREGVLSPECLHRESTVPFVRQPEGTQTLGSVHRGIIGPLLRQRRV